MSLNREHIAQIHILEYVLGCMPMLDAIGICEHRKPGDYRGNEGCELECESHRRCRTFCAF